MKSNLLFLALAALIIAVGLLLVRFAEIPFPWATFAILIGIIIVSWFWYRSDKSRSSSREDRPEQ